MRGIHWAIICLSYIVGLLLTRGLGFSNGWQWGFSFLGLVGLSFISALILPRFSTRIPQGKFWIVPGLIAILAVVYFQLRIPYPQENDVSKILPKGNTLESIVEGKVLTESRLNASGRIRFELEAREVIPLENSVRKETQKVTGKLYVTLPLTEDEEFFPGQNVTLKGLLYQPNSAKIPGAFDFKTYLNRRGIFAGFKAEKLLNKNSIFWGLFQVRKRIIDVQLRGLGRYHGPLISSIVLGRQSVDLPLEITTNFNQAGLAHVLAVSGFHVALLLGVIVFLTRYLSPQKQLIIGVIILIIYIGLTGIQPSILRAGLMGIAGLIGMVYNRKVNTLGSLLLSITLLLLYNPLWIVDLGFQLSFLATFGLIVTASPLERKLDFLPPNIANLIAIPLAASLWTLPLSMHTFKVISTYSILCNIITAPLVTVISLGGMLSAAVGVIFPWGGSAIASLLNYPTLLLINIVKFFIGLPASSYAVGTLPIGMMLIIYGCLIGIWLNSYLQRHVLKMGLFIMSLIIIPIIYTRLTLVQVTLLPTSPEPLIIIQDRGNVTLINRGDEKTVKHSLIPFLTQQGINQVNTAIAFSSEAKKWDDPLINLSIKNEITYQELSAQKKLNLGLKEIELINDDPRILQVSLQGYKWIWLSKIKPVPDTLEMSPDVLLWSGSKLEKQWLERGKPKTAIAISRYVSSTTQKQLKKYNIKLYWTGRDGVIQWTPKGGFNSYTPREFF